MLLPSHVIIKSNLLCVAVPCGKANTDRRYLGHQQQLATPDWSQETITTRLFKKKPIYRPGSLWVPRMLFSLCVPPPLLSTQAAEPLGWKAERFRSSAMICSWRWATDKQHANTENYSDGLALIQRVYSWQATDLYDLLVNIGWITFSPLSLFKQNDSIVDDASDFIRLLLWRFEKRAWERTKNVTITSYHSTSF